MPSVTLFHYRFTPTWKITFLFIFAFAFFIYLGMWQLERAKEKKSILFAHSNQNKFEHWQPGMFVPQPYQGIAIEGTFIPENLLLDNQHHNHQIGFNVLTPLKLNNGELILIDRGWIPAGVTREALPQPSQLKKRVYLTGEVYYPSKKSWLLGQEIEKQLPHLVLLERIDTNFIGQFYQKTVLPFIIRMNKIEPNGYVREWAVVSMSPERHQAYALQWFMMAMVLLIMYITLNSKRVNP